METVEAMRLRHSVRSYQDRQLDAETVQALLEAAYMAPVAMAAFKRFRLTVVQDPAVLAEIDAAGMAEFGKPGIHMLTAPTLLVLSAGELPFPGLELETAGCVMESVMLRAADLGVGSVYNWLCGEGIRKNPALSARLGLPEGWRCVACLALGYAREETTPVKTPHVTIETNYV